ncbi:MAG TPA: ABC transporter permease subunit, partial [Gemmatales bacterium]|nr:ABC transporter permease subunit [Gemmatales bacterium]
NRLAYATGPGAGNRASWKDRLEVMNQKKMDFAARYLGKFFPLQLLVLLLITPALSAGALGQEKEKDTLTALFGTELHDDEIVRGKVLGRYLQLVKFILISVPLVFVLAGIGKVDLMDVFLNYVHALVITFCMVGICIFSAVITRRTRDAIMACYSIIIIIALVSLTALGDQPLPLWLNPVEMVVRLSAAPFTSVTPVTLATHLFIFWFIGYFFVKLSCWSLRPTSLKQLEDRSSRWRWGIRKSIGDAPIRWRERHILGIAPLPALRSIPTWLGAIGCVVFSMAMIGGIINNSTQGRLVQHFMRMEWTEFVGIFYRLSPTTIANETILMGVILIFFAGITVLVRSAGAISEEKRMKTWDDLLMTAIPVQQIATQKMWGIIQASILFIFCYALPL